MPGSTPCLHGFGGGSGFQRGATRQRIRTEPGSLEYSLHPAASGDDGALLVVQRFASAEAFRSHARLMAELDGPGRLAALTAAPLQPPRLFAA